MPNFDDDMTEEVAEYEILKRTNAQGKLGIGLQPLPAPIQEALERMFDNDWLHLIDVCFLAAAPEHLSRVYKVTPAGQQRLDQLRLKFFGKGEVKQ